MTGCGALSPARGGGGSGKVAHAHLRRPQWDPLPEGAQAAERARPGNLKSELAFVLSGPFLSFASLSLLPRLGTKASHSLDSLTVRTPLKLLIACG